MDDQDMPFNVKDLIIASIPAASSTALGAVNQVVGIIGGLLGIAYLVWKWKQDMKQ